MKRTFTLLTAIFLMTMVAQAFSWHLHQERQEIRFLNNH